MSPSGELRDRVYGDLRFQRRFSRGVVSWGGGGGCHLSATPTRTMCTVVPEAVFTRATFQAAFRSTRSSADSANAIYGHMESFTYETFERANFDLFTHQKIQPPSFFDLVSAEK